MFTSIRTKFAAIGAALIIVLTFVLSQPIIPMAVCAGAPSGGCSL